MFIFVRFKENKYIHNSNVMGYYSNHIINEVIGLFDNIVHTNFKGNSHGYGYRFFDICLMFLPRSILCNY